MWNGSVVCGRVKTFQIFFWFLYHFSADVYKYHLFQRGPIEPGSVSVSKASFSPAGPLGPLFNQMMSALY